MITNFSQTELSKLIQAELAPTDFSIDNIKLSASYEVIPLKEIVELNLFQRATGQYIENASDYTFQERLDLLNKCDGLAHLAGGLTCGITNEKITQIGIKRKYLESLCSIEQSEIEKCHGKPDAVLVDESPWSVLESVESVISVYRNQQLYFFFEPGKLTLKEVRIGQVNEEYYTEQ